MQVVGLKPFFFYVNEKFMFSTFEWFVHNSQILHGWKKKQFLMPFTLSLRNGVRELSKWCCAKGFAPQLVPGPRRAAGGIGPTKLIFFA